MAKSNPVENLYMRIFKQVLGVQRQTTNVGVLLELGRHPLSFEARRLAIKNWERIKAGRGIGGFLQGFIGGASSLDILNQTYFRE